MAEPIGSAAGGHPDLNLNPEEKRVYGELLKEADPDGFGAVSGDVAVKFFERTKLAADVLGQIWQIADTENRGFLTPSGFGVVLRLIGHAQAGRVPAASLAPQPAPLPKFDTIPRQIPVAAPAPAPLAAQMSGTPSSPSSSGPGPIRVPPLSPEKVNEYSGLFDKSGAENGYLSGLVAKQIFERARLSNEVLGRIWNLADTQGRGTLDVTEFVIAMHLLASCKSGAMRGVPISLPPGLYDAASRRPPPRMTTSPRPGSASGFHPGFAPQFTGYGGMPQSPIVRQQAGTPLSAQSTGDGWAVTSADKARFDQIFATVDRQGTGYINGEQAVTFFANARLSEEGLAQIWDLADINSDGRLNRDEFAVAMYLIRQQRGSKDGRGNLPPVLPAALVPPSMRRQIAPPSQTTAPAFDNVPTQPRSAAEDLFGLDVLSPSQPTAPLQPAQTQIPQSTGETDNGFFGAPTSPKAPPPAATAAATSIFKPFQPSSSFGQSMIPQSTGPPAPILSRAVAPSSASEDLLSDGDATISSKLTNETAELGNLSNQVGTLSREMTDLQGKRAQADQELSQNAQQKRTFETRLTQLRAAFDAEVKEFKSLQEQLTASRNETKRLQQDMAMVEGNHTDTKRQHDQLRTAYTADQQENTSLKERIRQINVENDQLKPQIEKLKSDARQQKGLVAINKKQLATNEQERDRLHAELKAAQKEVEDALREVEETHRQIEASRRELEAVKAQPKPTMPIMPTMPTLPAQPAVVETRSLPQPSQPLASPTPSTVSNPFMRRDAGAVFSPPMGSPEPTHDHSAFDSIFGPSFGTAAATNTGAPSTSFRSETPPQQVTSHESLPHVQTDTPTSSVAEDIVEPPAPPSTKQITSDALPMRFPLERTESMTSSVKVIPPASRLSPADTPRATTPGISTPSTDKLSTDPFGLAAADEEQESVRRTLPRADTSEKTVGIPGAFPSATPRSETPVQAQGFNPTAIAVSAGAAAVAAGAGLAALVTGAKEEKKEPKFESPVVQQKAPETANFDEYFGGPAHQRTPSEQVKDFDAAFAGLSGGPPATNGTAKATHQEFPDIQEVDDVQDDDSSVYSEEAPLGFDDDFNTKPATIAHAPTTSTAAISDSGVSSKAAGKQPEVASAVPGYLQARPPLETVSSTASSLPGFETQTSPPTYNDSVPMDNPSHFPPEYKGLLPERADPTSPPPTASGSSYTIANSSGPPAAYGPEVAKSQEDAIAKARTLSAPKPSAFDFDSAFASMGTAQVEEDDSDEAETVFGSQRDQLPEFDPNFGSPAQSRATTVASARHSPVATYNAVTTHDIVTNGAPSNPATSSTSFFGFNDSIAAHRNVAQASSSNAPVSNTNTVSNTIPGFDDNVAAPRSTAQVSRVTPPAINPGASSASFFGFNDSIAAPNTAAQTSSVNQPAAVSHDWDTLFAPLDTQPASSSNELTKVETQHTEISPEASARTSAMEISGTNTPVPTRAIPTAPLPSSSLKVARPQPGRAVSAGTEHDDPILKRLTAMGWSRTDSLSALEKFDYNIDKAADYLTFRS